MDNMYEKYVGLVFDNRYRIEKVIGVGGMAIVFKATDLLMRRVVAVKILKDEISADEQSVKRFVNESKAVAMLSHQNIVNIYDVSVRENVKYIVMEFIEGITLKNYMQHREVLNLREIISYSTQMLRALDHAHRKGIVHRDIKPQNIMLLKNGVIKVTDFGIAKLPNAETISMADKAIGTVYYISPEQVSGKDIDARSDLYSMGVMMYEMATGSLPFTAETPISVAMKQVNDTPVSPREVNPYIPVGLEQIILKAMEKDPEDRYQSAAEMLEQLLKLRENPKIVFKEKKAKTTKSKNADGEGKPKRKQSKSMFPIILGVVLAFLIVAGVSLIYMYDKLFVNSTINNYADITVEDFVGTTYTLDLDDWFKNSEYYSVPEIEYEYNENIPKGTIISQDPDAGETRRVLKGKQKCDVKLTVSLGEKTTIIDNYIAEDYRTAKEELKKMGVTVKIVNEDSEIYETGYIIRTDPVAGTVVSDDTVVILYVSSGSYTANTNVPSFIGLNEAQALSLVIESNLSVGEVRYKDSVYPAGTVLDQSVTAYTEVQQYTAVSFTISNGYSNVPVVADPDEDTTDGGDDTDQGGEQGDENPDDTENPGEETPSEVTDNVPSETPEFVIESGSDFYGEGYGE